MNSRTRNQHYVPQFLLKNFSSGKKEQIFVYQKNTSKVFKTKTRNVASERDFYNFKVLGEEISLEESMTNIESKCSRIIKKIISTNSLSSLSFEDKTELAFFTALQLLRTQKHRDILRDFDQQIKDKVKQMGGDINNVKGYTPLNPELAKEFSINSILKDTPEFAKLIAMKSLILYEAPKDRWFYISDAPIAMFNHRDLGPYGNIGLLVPGIEIYLPISHKLALCFSCTTISESIKTSCEQIQLLLQVAPDKLKALENPSRLIELHEGFTKGIPVKMVPENIEHHNSLQAYHSSQYVFSFDGNFELLNRMKEAGDI